MSGFDLDPQSIEVPAGIFNHFRIQVAVSLLKLPYGGFRKGKRPLRNRFRSETVIG
jgi:hypothetical protein